MHKKRFLNGWFIFALFVFSVIFTGQKKVSNVPEAHSKFSKRLANVIQNGQAGKEITTWIFFTDKGGDEAEKLHRVERSLTAKSYQRRVRNRGSSNLVDAYDIPVNPSYLRKISGAVIRIRHRSRWLNAVSVQADAQMLQQIAGWNFVKKIDLVAKSTIRDPQPKKISTPKLNAQAGEFALNYGASFTQNDQINVPAMHDLGFDGSGVLIAMFDAGFNNLQHEAFSQLDIVATWDFANNDSNVDDQAGQLGNGDHGTWTLSAIGGFKQGQLIGPAYGADFLLAKTEITNFEAHIEEDNWLAAAEWADSLGADIISSSLGYRDGFTDGGGDYSFADMDGKTTIVTKGAEIAASRGILIVNSAGNEGAALPGQNSIVAPSDGADVLCIGAVDAMGSRTFFSSEGPSADGRIKPDVMAMGRGVRLASSVDPAKYVALDGTSFSCPLVAGAAALLLQAVPTLTNTQIMDFLRNTASNSTSPNNSFGWGIIDVLAAYNQALVTSVKKSQSPVTTFILHPAFPNPFNPSTVIQYDLPDNFSDNSRVLLKIYNVLGQEIVTLVDAIQQRGSHRVQWRGQNSHGEAVSTGVYIYRLQAGHRSKSGKVVFLK